MKRPRKYTAYDIELTIYPSVFHPGIFLSTNIFIEFIQKLDFEGKKVLELGAGSGMISFYTAKYKKAIVTASDINPTAIEALKKNSLQTKIPIEVIQSDLFENLVPSDYDFILINPPYYPNEPQSWTEKAFYCGADFAYFVRLFEQLNLQSPFKIDQVYLILSQDCDVNKIKSIAAQQQIYFHQVHHEKKMGEWNYIYLLNKKH